MAVAGEPTTFITLTSNPHSNNLPCDRARALVDGWRTLVKRIKKTFRYDRFEYLVVMEATKRGEPHLHILCRAKFIPQKWLSDQWADIVGAPIVDIRKIRSASMAASYVAKYIGKDPHKFGTLKRYYRSQRWRAPPAAKPDAELWRGAETRVLRSAPHIIVAVWLSAGWTIDECKKDFAKATGPPGGAALPLWNSARAFDAWH